MLVESANFMRLSLTKAAHAAVSQSGVAGNSGALRSRMTNLFGTGILGEKTKSVAEGDRVTG